MAKRKSLFGRLFDKVKSIFVEEPKPQPKPRPKKTVQPKPPVKKAPPKKVVAKKTAAKPTTKNKGEIRADILTRRVTPTKEHLDFLLKSVKEVDVSTPFAVKGKRIRYTWITQNNEHRMTRWQYVGKRQLTGDFILGGFYNAMDAEIRGAGSDPDFRLSDIKSASIESTG